MTAPFDYNALWTKAKLFINRSFSAMDAGDFDEAALWAACALELLGKAALSKINPLLIADPVDDGKSLLIAAGVSNDFVGFKSVQAKGVFSRCARAFPPFAATEATRIAASRNEDLHSGSLPFAGLNEDVWWQRYWAQAVLLIQAQDESIDSFVPPNRVAAVEGHLAKNRASLRLRVESLIQRARQRLELVEASALSARVTALVTANRATLDFDHTVWVECPACEGDAELGGSYVSDSDITTDDEGVPWETLTVQAEGLVCPTCGLELDGPQFVAETQAPSEFEVERELEYEWDDYGNE